MIYITLKFFLSPSSIIYGDTRVEIVCEIPFIIGSARTIYSINSKKLYKKFRDFIDKIYTWNAYEKKKKLIT